MMFIMIRMLKKNKCNYDNNDGRDDSNNDDDKSNLLLVFPLPFY